MVRDFEEAQELFHSEGWTDGLPIVPPTAALVASFLAAAGLEPDRVVGSIPERGREVTAEKVAINAVMAGCAAEYFPVVLAAWECLVDPAYWLNAVSISTSGAAPLVIVNGPVVDRVGMRATTNVLGPGNRANASIGRAVTLMLANLVGAAGELDKACIGHPGKYVYCIAEDEDAVWEPLHVQRGCRLSESAVTVVQVEGPQHVRQDFATTPEQLLLNVVDQVRSWNQGGAGVLIFAAEHRRLLQSHGWTKDDVSRFVHEESWRTVADLKRAARIPGEVAAGDESTRIRMAAGPHDFLVVAAGGFGPFSAVIPPWADAVRTKPVTRPVRLAAGEEAGE